MQKQTTTFARLLNVRTTWLLRFAQQTTEPDVASMQGVDSQRTS